MITKKIIVKPKTSFISKFHSDTFFGEFCRYASFMYGKDYLFEKIGLKNKKANIAFSNPLPENLFPIPKYWITKVLESFNIENENDYDYLKKFKKLKYISLDIFELLHEKFLKLSKLENQEEKNKSNEKKDLLEKISNILKKYIDTKKDESGVKTFSNLHVAIDRISFGALEGALFEIEEYFFKADKLIIFFKYDEKILKEEEIKEILHVFGEDGFGAKKSVGKGSFDFEIKDLKEIEKRYLVKDFKTERMGYITSLSVGFPLKEEIEENSKNYIETFTTFPKHGPDAYNSGIFKIPLIMSNIGSTFKIKEYTEIYGDLVKISGKIENNDYKYRHSRLIVPIYV